MFYAVALSSFCMSFLSSSCSLSVNVALQRGMYVPHIIIEKNMSYTSIYVNSNYLQDSTLA